MISVGATWSAATIVELPGELYVCLAIPMQIVQINDFQCVCETRGVRRDVSLFMLQDETLEPGDHVLVHVGYAIQKVSADDAAQSWELLDQILAADA